MSAWTPHIPKLYWTLYCTLCYTQYHALYHTLCSTLYCTIHCSQSKWLSELTYSLRNIPFPTSCTLYLTRGRKRIDQNPLSTISYFEPVWMSQNTTHTTYRMAAGERSCVIQQHKWETIMQIKIKAGIKCKVPYHRLNKISQVKLALWAILLILKPVFHCKTHYP